MSGLVTTGTVNIEGTGGIIEGNLGTANVNVNLDPVYGNFNADTSSSLSNDNDFDNIWDGNGGLFSAWIYAKSDGEGNFGRIASKNQWLITLRSESSGFCKIQFNHTFDSDDGAWQSTDRVIPVNSWCHVAVFYDSDSASNNAVIYVNGVAVAITEDSTPTGTRDSDASSDLYIGNQSDGTRGFDGYMMDIKIYKNTAWTQPEIAVLASKINVDKDHPGLPAPGPRLYLWWKAIADATTDSSGSGNNLTASNMGSVVYDAFSVDVYDGHDGSTEGSRTQTDGDFTVTQGKVEGLDLSSVDLNGTDDYININNPLESWTESAQKTFAAWVYNDGNSNTARIFNVGFEDSGQKTAFGLGMSLSTANKPYAFLRDTSAGAIQQEFGEVHSNNTWMHYAIVQDGANDQAFLYQNGVLQATVSSVGEINQTTTVSAKMGVHWTPAQSQYFDGKIKDVRLYDYNFSDEQVASLYSATYPQTPLHHWKLDEGYTSGTAANTAGAFEDSGTGTDYDAQGSGLVNASCVNGTLNLDGKLTIEANGTLSAPRGSLDVHDDFKISADTSTFTHNNGTVTITSNVELLPFDPDSSENARHIFYNVEHTSGTLYIERPTIIENQYTKTGGTTRQYTTTTFGTATSAGTMTINNGSWDFYGYYGNPTLQGANQLYPLIVTGSGYASDGPIDWDTINNEARSPDTFNYIKWIDFQEDMVTGGDGGDAVLLGDCKFAAFTLSSGDSLDLNGQRAEFTGNVTYHGDWDADGLAVFHGGFTKYGTLTNAASGDIMTMSTSGYPTFSYITGYRTFFQNGGVQLGTGGFTNVNTAIVAGETKTGTRNTSATNLTIPISGNLKAEDNTHTVSGNLNIAGGLIGKSALDFDGTSECLVSDHSDFDSLTNATWMGWYKIDDVSTDSNFIGQSSSFSCQVFENSTNKPRFSLYDSGGGGWTDLEGNTTITVDNKWHHIAFVMDGSNNKMYTYLDGKLDSEGAWTGTLNGSGADIYIGGYRSGNVKGFKGLLGNASFWNVALTSTQIRTKMFSDFASLDSNTGCKGWWQFDEGTGGNGDTTASSVGSHPATLGPAGNAPNWVGAGTFTRETSGGAGSTVQLTGDGSASFAGTSTEFHNLEVASSGKTTTFVAVGGDDKRPVIRGTLTHGGGTLTTSTNCSIDIGAGGTVSSGADTSGLYFTRWNSTTAVPALTSKYLTLQANVDLAGDQTNTQYIQFYNNHNMFDFNITTHRIISYANSNVTMGAGTIEFTSTTGWGSNVYDNRVFTAGPGATIKGVGAKSGFASGPNWEVVGDVINLDVTNEELVVAGTVTNCTGDIIQWHHSHDYDQKLDADTADDRDIKLGGPALDNANALNT